MRYKKFIIRNYRAINGPMEIDVSKNSLIPIIGVNECGKTTILHAVFSFDHNNDTLNANGRHLQDTANLYSVNQGSLNPKISAEIEITFDEFRKILKEIDKLPISAPTTPAAPEVAKNILKAEQAYGRLRNRFDGTLTITRDLKSKQYTIDNDFLKYNELNLKIAPKLIAKLPYLLYFDDFRDSVDNKVEISKSNTDNGWLDVFETLFEKTDQNFSVYKLQGLEERQRKTVLAKVNRKLNQTLTREWQNFRLDNTEALQISIDYEEDDSTNRAFLKLDVIETDTDGDQHYFFVRDRSKGFYWFFNFVMKLEFNPKVIAGSDVDAIYLLDEPGSYLHAAAQAKLASKLRQLSNRNKVIYCTHSHHLLDPEVIPISTIRIAEKDGYGNVQLIPLNEHKGKLERRSAYQPLIDALQIRPLALEFGNKPTVIVEGIFDYYLLDIFKGKRNISAFPSVGAQSIKYHISLMIAWRVPYCALWDNDNTGRTSMEDAKKHFGDKEASERFRILSLKGRTKDRIMQNLIDGNDLVMLRTKLNLPSNSPFEKVILTWYYSSERDRLLKSISQFTKENFEELFESLPLSA